MRRMAFRGFAAVFFLLVVSATIHGQEVSAVAQTKSFTLEQAVTMALRSNPALHARQDEADAAKARVGQARAAWFPRLDASQEFTRGNNPVYVFGTLLTQRNFTAANFALAGLNAPAPLDNFQTRLDAQMTLFDSGKTYLREKGARKLATAADYQTEQARQDLILRVAQSYYGVIVAREDLQAAQEALHAAEANEQRVHALEQAGQVVSSDLLSAQVFRAQMNDREIRAENTLEVVQLNLGRELGLPPGAMPEPTATLGEPGAGSRSLEEWQRAGLAQRPLLRAAELGGEAAATSRKLAKAAFGPQVGLFADIERDAETLGGPSGTNWTAGARVDINLFAGGADRYRLAETVAREHQAKDELDWLRSGVELQVRQSYLETAAAARRAAAARDAVAEAQDSLRIIQNRYEAGLVTITELLRAQTAQLEAKTGYLAALHDWQVARAQLEHAAGELTAQSKLIREGEAQ